MPESEARSVGVSVPSPHPCRQSKHGAHSETIRLIRDGEKGGWGGVWRWGEWEIIYLSLHCHHQNDACIKTGSDESHFNFSVRSDGHSHN